MSKITQIKWKGQSQIKARIYLDDEFWMTLPVEIIEALGFYPGFAISPDQRQEIEVKIVEENAKLFCMRSLNWKMQSRAQLRKKLKDREVPEEIAERVLDRMIEIGILDDRLVAESVSRALRSRGYGRMRSKMKLRELGINDEITLETLEATYGDDEDEELAEALAAMGNRYKTKDDYQRAFGFLVRRGFSMSAASKACKTLPAKEEEEE
jgi:regulatory protein